MARQPSVAPVPSDGPLLAASVLPGVPLPAWTAGPVVAAAPEPEPVQPAVATEPQPELVSVGATVGADLVGEVDAAATTELSARPAPPVAGVSPSGAATVLPVAVPTAGAVAAPAVLPAGAPSAAGGHHAVPQLAAPPSPGGGSRRLVLLVGAVVVVAAGAFAAFVTPGFLVSSSDEVAPAPTRPATTVTLPATVAGYTTVTTPAGKAAAAAAAKTFARTGARSGTASVYAHGATTVTVAAGVVAGDPAGYLVAWQKAYAVTRVATAASGQATVKAQCGATTVAGKAATACGFAGPRVAGAITVPGLTPAQAAKLLPAFVAAPVRH